MKTEDKKQLKILGILVIVLALISAINVFMPIPSQLEALQQELPASKPILALANFGIILIIYGLLGLFGYKLSRKLNWPGIFSEKASKKELFLKPLYIGLFLGFVLIAGDKIFSQFHSLGEFPHPAFPFSILASLSAGIGEEIIFKLFLVSFWAFILGFFFKKFNKQNTVNWVAIVIAALAFGAGHLPAFMLLYGFTSIAQIPAIFILEVLLLNGIIGVISGREFIKYGLIAAIGIHFWTDVVWHVIYGLF
jgi:membrane protease YdiL (CAAX protease family)